MDARFGFRCVGLSIVENAREGPPSRRVPQQDRGVTGWEVTARRYHRRKHGGTEVLDRDEITDANDRVRFSECAFLKTVRDAGVWLFHLSPRICELAIDVEIRSREEEATITQAQAEVAERLPVEATAV